jgi:hypothetical protein
LEPNQFGAAEQNDPLPRFHSNHLEWGTNREANDAQIARSVAPLGFTGGAAGMEAQNGSGVGAPVVLNVYDLTPMNNYLYWFGLGIFHSGIEGAYVPTSSCLGLPEFIFHSENMGVLLKLYCCTYSRARTSTIPVWRG